MKILLPVDGSEYTQRMLDYIAAHGELLGKEHEYVAVTVVPAVPSHAARFLDRETIDGYVRDQAEEVLKPVREFATAQGWTVRGVHVVGTPAEAIAAAAEKEQVGLVVMGTHGRGAFGNVVLGSVATGVLARCKVPVLLIR